MRWIAAVCTFFFSCWAVHRFFPAWENATAITLGGAPIMWSWVIIVASVIAVFLWVKK